MLVLLTSWSQIINYLPSTDCTHQFWVQGILWSSEILTPALFWPVAVESKVKLPRYLIMQKRHSRDQIPSDVPATEECTDVS